MRNFATLTFVCFLISVNVIKHAEAQICSQLTPCVFALTTALAGAGKDISKLCSAYNTYVNCLNKAASGCSVDISDIMQTAKNSLSQYGCSSSGGDSIPDTISSSTPGSSSSSTPGSSSSSNPGSSSTPGGSSSSVVP
ncbi:uncharacterized protein LOC134271105 [Saccostrea cucullata]|uniref:uncharacterized protein LOC134271105 n=1 Tax=Saccostrea cuccullata TaxID=36930 RepID=UPI002ED38905